MNSNNCAAEVLNILIFNLLKWAGRHVSNSCSISASMNVGVFHLGRHAGSSILVLSSILIGILSSLISWRVRGGTFILVGVLVLCFYLLKLALYAMTHSRIVQRFPAERDKSRDVNRVIPHSAFLVALLCRNNGYATATQFSMATLFCKRLNNEQRYGNAK